MWRHKGGLCMCVTNLCAHNLCKPTTHKITKSRTGSNFYYFLSISKIFLVTPNSKVSCRTLLKVPKRHFLIIFKIKVILCFVLRKVFNRLSWKFWTEEGENASSDLGNNRKIFGLEIESNQIIFDENSYLCSARDWEW